jgi:hypothetical protein
MIELPSEKPVTRPFDLKLAKMGAPVMTHLGFRARIICFDRCNAYNGSNDIVALVKRQGYSDYEEALTFNHKGEGSGRDGALGDLVMSPLISVEGKAVFHGDTVYENCGEPLYIRFEDFHEEDRLPMKTTNAANLFLNPPPIQFEGESLANTDSIWYRNNNETEWTWVKCSERWSDLPTIPETHFEYLKRNVGRKMALNCYTRKSPHSMILEGTELKVGDVLWYTHPTAKGKSLVLTSESIKGFKLGNHKVTNYTRVQPKKSEVWQGLMVHTKIPNDVPVPFGYPYDSSEECDEKAPPMIPPGYEFVGSRKIKEHYL